MSEQISTHNQNTNSNDQIDLYELLGALLDNKWKIVIITAVFTLVSIAYALLATPIYSASALVQVEQNAASNVLSKLTDMMPGSKPESQTEISLLQSRMVLGEAVDELALDTVVQEKHFPVVGKGLARLLGQPDGKIAISRLTVPDELLDTPFTLTVLSPDQYSITINDETLQGKTGELLSKADVNLLVSEINAPAGTTFLVTKLEKLSAINKLLENLTVSELSKDSGMLQLNFKGESAKQATQILNSVSNIYLQQNVGRKSEEAAKSLEFLKEQLPLVRAKLDDAENRLNQYRQKNESVDLSLEAKSVLDNTVALETQINELTFKEAEISKLYTRDHPAYRTLLEKKALLLKERDKLNARIGNMPKTQQEILSLTRDVQSGQEVYMLLLNKQQELNINKASTVGNVRIIDTAVAEKRPIAPKKSLIVVAGMMLGLFISVAFCLLRKFLHSGIESSEQIESLGLNVYASIPTSKWLKDKNMKLAKSKRRTVRSVNLLAKDNPTDLSVEAIRSLRTSLHFAMMQAENNILLISGATPEAGKTFVSCNLAAVIAQADKKVLLIDADLRKGQVHHVIGCPETNGLSDALIGTKGFADVIKQTEIENLAFISRGQIPPNPSELLMNENFKKLMEWASSRYDLVIVDTPPVLAVSDACIAAKYAGTTMLVARFQINTLKEMEVAAKRFAQNNLTINGVIFNGAEKRAANYYEYGAYNSYA
ncbi:MULTISPECIES: polysaccharide biosynthesis tyrosine autokinase [Buttiauxella]|uniref:polysaccharide biosynthesis tyrosine autokinase n=1 Tax=Buttiauxella TaxID=82976 RepID=UPI00155FD31F|nr:MULTISPECIES: polysaccharide biosynthesis tyrosine autokinase [Buttiauxella]MCS3603717.1 tyrosine-protein kinase Etk/Wzc [Buttiauxella sp. BIGb0471]BCG07546.1 polysaccharide biosynthesis tyrosine autokinase [Buttiauxella agrestis]